MKKITVILITLLSIVSCMSETNYSESYTAYATFEYLGEDYTQLFGSDSLYYNTIASSLDYESAIGWSSLGFNAKVSASMNLFEGGFILSYLKAANDTTAMTPSPYRVYGNPEKLNTYMVFHDNPAAENMPSHDMFFSMAKYGTCAVQGCGICNTEEVVKFVRENFEDGDRLVVRATGYLEDVKTATAEFPLADFATFRDSVVTKWTFFDLEKLGDVDFVDFEISSTKPGVPAYFCLDDMIANVSIAY